MKLNQDQDDIHGNWWNPDEPGIKWHGVLSLKAGHQGQVHLTNYGRSVSSRVPGGYPDTFKVLHGTSSEGEAITLWQCVCRAHSRSEGAEEASYSAMAVLFGAHFVDDEFDGIEVEFDYLNDWMTYTRFRMREDSDEDIEKEFRIRLNARRAFPFEASDYSSAKFFLGYRTFSSGFTFSIENRSNLQYRFRERQSLKSVLNDLRQWQRFLTLGTNRCVHVARLDLYRAEDEFEFEKMRFLPSLHVWLASESETNPGTLHDSQMTFSFPQIEGDLNGIIGRWKQMQTSWATVLQGYFASLHRPELRLDEIFLARARAVEALQVARAGDEPSSGCFKAAWEAAPSGLRKCLGDEDAFSAAALRYRNYLVHLRPKDEPDDPDERQLFELSQKLEFILKVAILERLGIPDDIVAKAYDPRRWSELISFD